MSFFSILLYLYICSMKSKQAKKQAFPNLTFSLSFSDNSAAGRPHGLFLVRITEVRSLAILKLLQGGAIIAPMICLRFMSRISLLLTCLQVRSRAGSSFTSQDLARKPSLRAAAATPPAPLNKSATYDPLETGFFKGTLAPAHVRGVHPRALRRKCERASLTVG